MKPNELRIGNYISVSVKNKNNEIKIFTGEINYLDVTEKEIYGSQVNILNGDLNDIEDTVGETKPIPINRKWLKNLGFRPINGHEFSLWIDEWECISFFVERNYYGIRIGKKDVFSRYVHSVHKLQNIFFALTGKELTIQEDKS
jgi:hypothetical protein